jgi:hypothetical protein
MDSVTPAAYRWPKCMLSDLSAAGIQQDYLAPDVKAWSCALAVLTRHPGVLQVHVIQLHVWPPTFFDGFCSAHSSWQVGSSVPLHSDHPMQMHTS